MRSTVVRTNRKDIMLSHFTIPHMTSSKSHRIPFFLFNNAPQFSPHKNQHPPNLMRPLASLRFNTLLPPTLSFLFINPCFLLFLMMEGWYVRLMNQVERSPSRDWRPSITMTPMDDLNDDVVAAVVAAAIDDDTIVFSWGNNTVIPRCVADDTKWKSSFEQPAEVAIQHRWPPWL